MSTEKTTPATSCAYTANQIKAIRFLQSLPNPWAGTAEFPFDNCLAANSVLRSLERLGVVWKIAGKDQWDSGDWHLRRKYRDLSV